MWKYLKEVRGVVAKIYKYLINDIMIATPRKLYKKDGVYYYRKGDFFEPVGPKMSFELSMAEMEPKKAHNQGERT